MPTSADGMSQECITDYLRKAAVAGVPTETVIDVVRLWSTHGTSAAQIRESLDELESGMASPVLTLRRYFAAVRELLGDAPSLIDLELPRQHTHDLREPRTQEPQTRGRS